MYAWIPPNSSPLDASIHHIDNDVKIKEQGLTAFKTLKS